jgi:hypothetical protein
MVFNSTFSNISVISWQSVLLVEETGENNWSSAGHWHNIFFCCLIIILVSNFDCFCFIVCCNHWFNFELLLFPGTVRVWHANTYRLESTLNYGLERVWSIACQRGSNNVALGYDEGSIMIKVGFCCTLYISTVKLVINIHLWDKGKITT